MKVKVFDIKGSEAGSLDLNENVFGVTPNEHAVYLCVKQYLAAQRQGTHKTKEKWEISRTTKKFKKQKGTGGARAGSLKSPLFRGGGRTFGPKPRDYSFKLNRKVRALGKFSALSSKLSSDEILVLKDFTFDSPKTKNALDILKNLSLGDKKSLFVVSNCSFIQLLTNMIDS